MSRRPATHTSLRRHHPGLAREESRSALVGEEAREGLAGGEEVGRPAALDHATLGED
jgi:hypothetical protein